jgi:hypothetical protein
LAYTADAEKGQLRPQSWPGMVVHTVIPALGRLKKEDWEFEASLSQKKKKYIALLTF